MDSDDEEEQMFAKLFEEEMAAAAQYEEHILILACVSGLYAEKAIGRRGGSAPASRGSEWRANAYSTPTTSPIVHCTVRLFLGVVSG
jgi:hypothetical protein